METNAQVLPEDRNYKEDLQTVIRAFENKLIEREPFIRLQLLFIFSIQHFFYIGEPGVGKTYFAKLICSCIKDAVFWEIQMTEGTTEKMLLGVDYDDPKSIRNAHFVFFDEMYKGKPEILVKFLSFLNERIFYENGQTIPVKLVSAIGASNEFPVGELVRPFDDRFMGRSEIKRIQSRENRKKFINKEFDKSKDLPLYFYLDDIDYVYEESKKVVMTDDFEKLYLKLMDATIKENVKCSDRKYGYAIEILKTSAFLNGRDYLDYSDIFIMLHIAWSDYRDRTNMKRILNEVMFGKKDEVQDRLNKIDKNITKIISIKNSDFKDVLNHTKEFSGKNKEEYYQFAKEQIVSILNSINLEFDDLTEIANGYEQALEIEKKINQNIFLYKEKNEVYTTEVTQSMVRLYERIEKNRNELNEFIMNNRTIEDYEDVYYKEDFAKIS